MLGEEYEGKQILRWRRTVLSWEGCRKTWYHKWRDNIYPRLNCFLLPTPRCFQSVFFWMGWSFLWNCHWLLKPFLKLGPLMLDGLEDDKSMTFLLGFDSFSGVKWHHWKAGNWGYLRGTWSYCIGNKSWGEPISNFDDYGRKSTLGWNPAFVLQLWWFLGNLIHVYPTILRRFY